MKLIRLFFIFLVAIIIFSCSKSSDRDEDTTTNSSEDFALGQSLIYDAFKVVHQAAYSSKVITNVNLADTNSLFGCDSITVDTTSTPMSLSIQFNGNCNERTGTITATFSSKYDALGTVVNITFSDYSFRGFQIGTGTITSSFTSLNGTLPVYSYSINNVKIINTSNKIMSFSGSQRLSFNQGETTAEFTDDSYTITGSASGSTFRGNEYNATFTTDLILQGNCNWISSGTVIISPENKSARTLDFGSGCNALASVSVNGVEQEITIP